MNEVVSEKKVLIYDDGMNMWLAERLARDFMTVWIYTPWESDYPRSQDDVIGEGLQGVIRISDFEAFVDAADLIIFPGLYHGGLQERLVKMGKLVWGSRYGDELERYRLEANKLFTKLGLPRPTMQSVVGMDKLREHLKKVEDKYIKVSNYRKDFETWHHDNYALSEPVLDELEHRLGKLKDKYEFIVEDPIRGDDVVECGYDGYCVDGKWPAKTIFGYEVKDVAYCGHVKEAKELSPLITDFNEKVSDELKKHEYKNFFSTEIRVGKDKTPYCIDVTTRFPSPNSELFSEMCVNLSEIFWYGAHGILVDPVFETEYGIEIMIDSSWSENKWQPVQFPEEIKRWVKLRNYTFIDGTYYVIPKYADFDNIGAVVATGKSMKECFTKVKEYADMIKGPKIEINIGSIDKLNDVIEKGEKLGIEF